MGRRGIGGEHYRPEGTSFSYKWPMGMKAGERKRLLQLAVEACGKDEARIVLWLGRNAWRVGYYQSKDAKEGKGDWS